MQCSQQIAGNRTSRVTVTGNVHRGHNSIFEMGMRRKTWTGLSRNTEALTVFDRAE